jgi:hypothetical protein
MYQLEQRHEKTKLDNKVVKPSVGMEKQQYLRMQY